MVSAIGLRGIQWLNLARKAVPKCHSGRIQLITAMVNHSLTAGRSVTSTKQCETYLSILEQTSLCSMESDADMLKNYSMDTGQPTVFLVPPVTSCINSSCGLFGDENSLVQHHSPLTVILFNLSGPKPGIKQSLKCKSCRFIYNYSMYGHKQGEGERFYDEERDFIEVTDTVFCQRHLQNFFGYLR